MKYLVKTEHGDVRPPASPILRKLSVYMMAFIAIIALGKIEAKAQIGVPCSPNNPVIVQGDVYDVSCFGYENGAVDIEVSGGFPPYTYSWSNGASTEDIADLAPGIYTVDVYDNWQCHGSAWFIVGQPTELDLQIALTEQVCGQPSGCAIMSGGTAPYNLYVFTCTGGGPGITPEPTLAVDAAGVVSVTNTADFIPNSDVVFAPIPSDPNMICANDIPDGLYLVVLVDANGCFDYEWVHIQGNGGLEVSGDITEPTCYGYADGSVDVSISGGTAPYMCYWAMPALDGTTNQVEVDPSLVNNCSLSGITAGEYYLFVEDANGCTTTHTFHVDQNDPVNIEVVLTYPICGGQPNGCGFLSGGTGEYQIYIYEGPIVMPQPVDPVIAVDAAGNVSVTDVASNTAYTEAADILPIPYPWITDSVICADNIPDGHYLIIIVDSNGCYDYTWMHVDGSEGLSVEAIVTEPSCYGYCDGNISLEIEGGTAPYQCYWALPGTDPNGSVTGVGIDPTQINNCSMSNVCAGYYYVTVVDANGCEASITIEVEQNDPVELEIISTDNLCGQPDVCAIWSGGTGLYQVFVFQGPIAIPAPTVEPDIIVDANNVVSVTDMAPVADILPVPYPNPWTEDTIRCANGVPNGHYLVVVVDSNGCYDYEWVHIVGNGGLTVEAIVTEPSCYGYCDGSIGLDIEGGSAPYTCYWALPSTTGNPGSGIPIDPTQVNNCTLSNVCAGYYLVTVVDANGCEETITIEVEQNDPVNIEVIVTQPVCGGQPNACAFLTGGTGEYQVYVYEGPIVFPQPIDPVIAVDGTGNISVTDIAGNTTFTENADLLPLPYPWITDSVLCANGVEDGHYLVILIDSNGCFDYTWVHIEGTEGLTVNGTITEPACFGDATGSISVQIEGGTAPYSCAWAQTTLSGSTNQLPVDPALINNCSLSGITAGVYYLFVEDANGCTAVQEFIVNQPSELILEIALTEPACAQPSGCAIMSGGTAPYNLYVFTDPIIDPVPLPTPNVAIDAAGNVTVDAMTSTNEVDFLPVPGGDMICADNIPNGEYLVVLVDANGCWTYEWVIINASGNLEINLTFDQFGSYACAEPTGGAAPYMINWTDLSGNLQFPAISQDCIYDLPAGMYTVQVIDANGCESTEIFIICEHPCEAGVAEVVPSEIYSGMNATFILTGSAGQSVQWQFRTEFTNWLDVPNGTTTTFDTPPIYVASDKEIEVRALTTCADGTVMVSNVAVLTVYAIEQLGYMAPTDPNLFGEPSLTSIDQPDTAPDLTVYPSPTDGPIKLIISDTEEFVNISILDLNGKTIYTSEHDTVFAGMPIALDLTGHPAGVYLVNVRTQSGLSSSRIVLR